MRYSLLTLKAILPGNQVYITPLPLPLLLHPNFPVLSPHLQQDIWSSLHFFSDPIPRGQRSFPPNFLSPIYPTITVSNSQSHSLWIFLPESSSPSPAVICCSPINHYCQKYRWADYRSSTLPQSHPQICNGGYSVPFLAFLSSSTVDPKDILFLPFIFRSSPQIQQAPPANQKATPSREKNRLPVSLHFTFCSTIPNPLEAQPQLCSRTLAIVILSSLTSCITDHEDLHTSYILHQYSRL